MNVIENIKNELKAPKNQGVIFTKLLVSHLIIALDTKLDILISK